MAAWATRWPSGQAFPAEGAHRAAHPARWNSTRTTACPRRSGRHGPPAAPGTRGRAPRTGGCRRRDGGKRHQLHGVDLDLRRAGAIPPARPHPGPAPQPEGHGDVARQHRFPQIPAELHQPVLRLRPGAPAPPGRSPVPAFPRGAASLHPHLSGRRRDRSAVALTDQTPPAQRHERAFMSGSCQTRSHAWAAEIRYLTSGAHGLHQR